MPVLAQLSTKKNSLLVFTSCTCIECRVRSASCLKRPKLTGSGFAHRAQSNTVVNLFDLICRFSGLTADDLEGVTNRLRDVQAVLLLKFKANDILIGHSLESDLKVLKVSPVLVMLKVMFRLCCCLSSKPMTSSLVTAWSLI